MRYLGLAAGIAFMLLGGLWLAQGLGLVTMQPLLCFADCVPVVGPDATWVMAGLAALAIGGGIVAFARGRGRR